LKTTVALSIKYEYMNASVVTFGKFDHIFTRSSDIRLGKD